MTPPLLALWSAPRSRSTAFLRMMTERGDYTVVHEPFSHVVDFGVTTVGDREVRTEADLTAALRALSAQEPVFFKDTTDFHYPGLLADRQFLAEATHTFIIRHPSEAIASHFALNAQLQRDEIGFARLAEIHDAVVATGAEPVVVDSDDLVARPVETVRQYCALVGIPFRPEALSWAPGIRSEWEKTRPWHENTGRTNGFTRTESTYQATTENHPLLADYLRYHLPFYEKLRARRMTVPAVDPLPSSDRG
ncbi:sulfotransferase family protein [Actinocrispum wychmicini]|uniref:Sulfotransferase family protein n=1 Tax=Actinocrispum wychmicini TaxID=1213861 RepID=A0A4R2JGV4_9PSEU|nr:sulfotransferase family protein [Actinocrispum wychmicini]TCO55599.1 hypothetical protein EV192_10720 [Actinocrispum wychmicini]